MGGSPASGCDSWLLPASQSLRVMWLQVGSQILPGALVASLAEMGLGAFVCISLPMPFCAPFQGRIAALAYRVCGCVEHRRERSMTKELGLRRQVGCGTSGRFWDVGTPEIRGKGILWRRKLGTQPHSPTSASWGIPSGQAYFH